MCAVFFSVGSILGGYLHATGPRSQNKSVRQPILLPKAPSTIQPESDQDVQGPSPPARNHASPDRHLPPQPAPPPSPRLSGAGAPPHPPHPPASRVLFTTFATSAMKSFLLNWYDAVRRAGIPDTDIVIAPLDADVAALCRAKGMPALENRTDLYVEFGGMATGGYTLEGGSRGPQPATDARPFQQIGHKKTVFLRHLLGERSVPVLVSDVDVVWLSDPRPYLGDEWEPPARADVSVSSECLSMAPEVWQEGHCNGQLNTGLMYFRPTAAARRLLAQWGDGVLHAADHFQNDQAVFNRLHQGDWGEASRARESHSTEYASGLRVAVLPITLFTSGHTFFSQRMPEAHGVQPLAVHATFQYSHSLGKRQRFREAGLWSQDPPEYYSEGNFLTVDLPLPPDITRGMDAEQGGAGGRGREVSRWGGRGAEGPGAEGGAAGAAGAAGEEALGWVDRQMRAALFYRVGMRNAIALAAILNRTLIAPPFVCFCDRWWGNVLPSCRIPGSDTRLPYACPMDHLFFLPHWEAFASVFRFREHSFLRRAPPALTSSRRTVTLRAPDPGGAVAEGEGGGRAVSLPAFATDIEVHDELGHLADARVLHIQDPVHAFCKFAKEEDNNAFDRAMAKVLAADVWFCGYSDTPDKPGRSRVCRVGYQVPRSLQSRTCPSGPGLPPWWEGSYSEEMLVGVQKVV